MRSDADPSMQDEIPVPPTPNYFRGVAATEQALRSIATKHPDIAHVIDIGDSGDKVRGQGGSDILAIRLQGTGPSSGLRERVVLTAGIHPREIAPPAALLEWARKVTELYGRDTRVTKLLDEHVIDIVPDANPDGLRVVERGLHRELDGAHLQRTNTTAPHGVNLNRNFSSPSWGVDGPNSGSGLRDPENTDGNYCGPAPDSETETRVLERFLTHEPTAAFADWHTYGQWVMSPPIGGSDAARRESKRLADAVANRLELPSVQTPADLGMAMDWAVGRDIPSILAEVGGGKFLPDDAAYQALADRTLPAITEFVEQVGPLPV